jgi:hypothetical protein
MDVYKERQMQNPSNGCYIFRSIKWKQERMELKMRFLVKFVFKICQQIWKRNDYYDLAT